MKAEIIGLRIDRSSPDQNPEFRAFAEARQAMNRAFLAWLRAGAPRTDAAAEADVMAGVMRQLIQLEVSDAPR